MRRIPLATPGSVWLETVAVFLAMFLGVQVVVALVADALAWSTQVSVAVKLGTQWLVLLAIFWPVVRGMSLRRWREEIGWKSERGVLREMGMGVLGYFAGLPVYFGVAMIVVLVIYAVSYVTNTEPRPQGNKITDLIEGGAAWELAMLYLLATVWAPIVEESIFRGCLYRQLRRRWGMVLAGLGSAAVFAMLHGYVVQGLIVVGTLGFWFALLREWRGNIIASATAHALHNGVVLAVMLVVLAIAGA